MSQVEKKFEELVEAARKDVPPEVDVRLAVRQRLYALETPSDPVMQWLAWGAVALAAVVLATAYPYVADMFDPMGPMIYQAYSDGF